jgi:indolepyruvate ferredoxin oxidoreductase beta subunit
VHGELLVNIKTTSVLFSGVGGQGIILASKILAQCAFTEGLMVKECELHGMAQRGGSVISHVRFGSEVYSPLIPLGKADFLVAMEELEGLRYVPYLKSGAYIILNERKIEPSHIHPEGLQYPEQIKKQLTEMGFHVDTLDAIGLAKEMGNLKIENILLLGALSQYLSLQPSTWESVIRESVPPKTVDLNLAAFAKGREITAQKEA